MKENEQLLRKVIGMFRLCRIQGHVPGQVTLKVSALSLPRLAAMIGGIDDIEGKIKQIPGIMNYEPNIGWRGASVVVTYDPSVFPYELWQDLCSPGDDPAFELSVMERIRALYDGRGTRAES